jgi:DNA-binding HxlR family transcriptional regulator
MNRKRPPLPGSKVRGSTTGRPIMAALDLFGRRWSLRIIWELRSKTLTFRDLQSACGTISPAVLNTRLAELRDAGIIQLESPSGYRLSPDGSALIDALVPLHAWSERWASRVGSRKKA